jgi:hypothetical protein
LVRIEERQQKLLHNISCSKKGAWPVFQFENAGRGDGERGSFEGGS